MVDQSNTRASNEDARASNRATRVSNEWRGHMMCPMRGRTHRMLLGLTGGVATPVIEGLDARQNARPVVCDVARVEHCTGCAGRLREPWIAHRDWLMEALDGVHGLVTVGDTMRNCVGACVIVVGFALSNFR